MESIILDGAKRILGCSSKTCNEAVRGNMGLDTLQSRRDREKLKWWYKLATLPEDRYPKQLFNQEWNIKPRRGRQRNVWSRMVDDLFKSLNIGENEWLEDIKHGDSSSASFMACVEERISERESRKFEDGLNTKVKLDMYLLSLLWLSRVCVCAPVRSFFRHVYLDPDVRVHHGTENSFIY